MKLYWEVLDERKAMNIKTCQTYNVGRGVVSVFVFRLLAFRHTNW